MVWCTLKLTTVPDVFQVKLYSALCWNVKRWEASDVTQTGSVVLKHTLLCSTTIQPSHSTTYEWTMSLILPHGKKQVSQPLDWESHSLSCRTPTKWVSFLLLLQLVTLSEVFLLQRKRSWLDSRRSSCDDCVYVVRSDGMSLCDHASVQRCLLEYKPYEGSALSGSYTEPPPPFLSASSCSVFFLACAC